LDDLTAEQLTEWEVYNSIEPVGEFRGDLRIANLTSMLYNMISSFGSKKGRRHVSKPADFMPFFKEDLEEKKDEPQSVEEMKSTLLSIASSLKNQEKKEKKGV
jgi:hypothetical protein